MVLPMPSPTKHPKTGVYYLRVRVPADLTLIDGKSPYKWTLDTKDPAEAKTRFAAGYQGLQKRWASLRAKPAPIPHKQIMALVGKYRRELDAIVEMEPGESAIWARVLNVEAGHASTPEALESWAGADADRLLQAEGLAADDYSRTRLISEMHKARIEWATHQHRRAEGDYSPDPALQRYPEWRPHTASAGGAEGVPEGGPTLTELFARWERRHLADGKPAKTVSDYRQKVDSLRAFLGHDDARQVTARRVVDWCDHLRHEKGLKARTVSDKYLSAIKTVFKLAFEQDLLPANPLERVRARVPKPNRERPEGFTEAEARAILRASLVDPEALGRRSEGNKRAIRWVPWICAYTGARVGEIGQLRKQDLITEHGVLCLRITPEAGTVKGGDYRIVPVHPHLLEQGLVEFINSRPAGPLFFAPGGDPAARGQLAGARVGTWVREEVGITDNRVQPNHAWRHRFKTLCRDVGIDEETRNKIQGHKDGTAASDYGEVTVKALQRAILAFPRIDLQEPSEGVSSRP